MRRSAVLAVTIWMWAGMAGAQDGGVTGAVAAVEDAGALDARGADPPARALAEGRAALAEGPSARETARSAFERATSGDAATASEAYFRLGVLDEESVAPARALARYQACVDAAPSSRWARTARSRIAWIDERSEGDLAPLAALQRVRRDPALLHDAQAIDLLALQAESFPPGLVRSEARMLVAESWRKVAARHEDALGELRKVVYDPSSGPADAVFAERELVEGLLAKKELDAAASEVRAHPFDPKVEAEVRRLVRRRWLRRAASVELLITVLLGLVLVRRARIVRRRDEPRNATRAVVRRLPRATLAAALALVGLSVLAAAFVVADALDAKPLQGWGL
jgi:hypothetical protein